MKTLLRVLGLCWLGTVSSFSETLVLNSGNTVEGTIIRTNGPEVLLLTDFGTYGFAKTSIKELRPGPVFPEAPVASTRLSNFRSAVLSLSRQTWASNLTQIPATVIDKGVFKNVPYVSFRCSDDYEINIYGDLKDPAAIEAGVYRKLLTDAAAKQNCVEFIINLLKESADKEIVQSLKTESDIRQRAGFRFEITPPTAEDAYFGWWISVYSEDKLNRSRATDKELAGITVPKLAKAEADDASAWSSDEMKLARSQPETITFVNSSGETISNAVVARVVDGAYLIWSKGASGGRVDLSDLPEKLRAHFGYDPAHAAAVYSAEEQRRAAEARTRAVQAAQAQAQAVPVAGPMDFGVYGGSSGPSFVPSSGGSVYVRGYTRKDGTYVQPYTRRK